MEKSKKKSSVLRSTQQDYDYCSSRPSSSNAQRPLSRSVSPDMQRPSSTLPPPCPPRTTISFADVVNFHRHPRVQTKNQNRGIHHTAQSLSSPCRYGFNTPFPALTQPHRGPKLETPNGVTASPPPPGKVFTESHRPSSPVGSTGNPTVPQSPSLVHFSNFTATSSYTFLDMDLGMYKDQWRYSLIGFIAGKFPGYTSISTFVNNS